jgi:hypothetical protein
MFPATLTAPVVRPAAQLYATVKAAIAAAEAESAAWVAPPFTCPGGNPTIAAPGLTPTSPVTTLEPVFVTVEPARTAKLAADPRATAPELHPDCVSRR